MGYYDEIANSYNSLYGEEQLRKFYIINSYLKVKKSFIILDVGCGTGLITKRWCCNVIGIDPSLKLLLKATHGIYINAKAEFLPFKDNCFDIVVSITSIQNFEDVGKALQEIKRVGKRFFVITVLKKSYKKDKIIFYIKKLFKINKMIEDKHDLIFFLQK